MSDETFEAYGVNEPADEGQFGARRREREAEAERHRIWCKTLADDLTRIFDLDEPDEKKVDK